MAVATHHGTVNITQGLRLNALYTPTFRLSLISINMLDRAGYTMTFGLGICSISIDLPSTSTPIASNAGNLYMLKSPYTFTSEADGSHTYRTIHCRIIHYRTAQRYKFRMKEGERKEEASDYSSISKVPGHSISGYNPRHRLGAPTGFPYHEVRYGSFALTHFDVITSNLI
jgi:hypothetical protein